MGVMKDCSNEGQETRVNSCPLRRTSGDAFPCMSLTVLRFSAIPVSASGLSQSWLDRGYFLFVHLSAKYGYLMMLLPAHRNALEGFNKPEGALNSPMLNLHNLAHSFLNGTSVLPHAAANDPIFVVWLFPPAWVPLVAYPRQLSHQKLAEIEMNSLETNSLITRGPLFPWTLPHLCDGQIKMEKKNRGWFVKQNKFLGGSAACQTAPESFY